MKKFFNPFGVPVLKTTYDIVDGIRNKSGERAMLVAPATWDSIVKRPKVYGVGKVVEYRQISMAEFYQRKGLVTDAKPAPKPAPAPSVIPEVKDEYTDEDWSRDYQTGKELLKEGKTDEALEVLNRAHDFKRNPRLKKMINDANKAD